MSLIDKKTVANDIETAEYLYGEIILSGENWRLHDNGRRIMLWINQPGSIPKQSCIVECPEDVEILLRKGLKLQALEKFIGK